ncbi:hypothetical protein [Shewanella aestuarii]|uniref:Uncharacterized protein n=1 Tax=Shewanella aestuarii TaxID=1028752 RepID=A0A6G9QP74_9GAMM|nr:hypothetical protein [Shewanella aestuarii]QIR16394.1 hypothetical protein HBH39_18120 [Shewanella aestuarii]
MDIDDKHFKNYKSRIKDLYLLCFWGAFQDKLLGAYVSAEIKSIKRDHLCYLIKRKLSDYDVTPTYALNLCKNILGRGVDNKYLLGQFGRSGRTAAEKSKIFEMDIQRFENEILVEYQLFTDKLILLKRQAKSEAIKETNN